MFLKSELGWFNYRVGLSSLQRALFASAIPEKGTGFLTFLILLVSEMNGAV